MITNEIYKANFLGFFETNLLFNSDFVKFRTNSSKYFLQKKKVIPLKMIRATKKTLHGVFFVKKNYDLSNLVKLEVSANHGIHFLIFKGIKKFHVDESLTLDLKVGS